jgi:hypothetical protein
LPFEEIEQRDNIVTIAKIELSKEELTIFLEKCLKWVNFRLSELERQLKK